MLVTYPYRKYLSTYAAGFVDTESREVPEGLAAVAAGLGRTLVEGSGFFGPFVLRGLF